MLETTRALNVVLIICALQSGGRDIDPERPLKGQAVEAILVRWQVGCSSKCGRMMLNRLALELLTSSSSSSTMLTHGKCFVCSIVALIGSLFLVFPLYMVSQVNIVLLTSFFESY
jgi:hypothetical protein